MRGVLLLCCLCACGAEVAKGGVLRDPSVPASAPKDAPKRRVQEPIDLIPGDLELVLRVDLTKVRESLGAELSKELLRQAAIDDGGDGLLRSALQRAEAVWVGMRVADASAGDRVTVVRTIKQRGAPSNVAPDSIAWLKTDTALDGVTRFEARAAPVRGGTARVFTFGPASGADRSAVFVSPVEVMSVERVLERGPDAVRGQPEARGLLSLDYRVRPLTPGLSRRFPSLAGLWSGVVRVNAIVDVIGQRLLLDGRIRCKSGTGAEKVQRFLETIRDASMAREGDGGMAELMRGLELVREGSMVTARWSMSPEALGVLLRSSDATPEAPPEAPPEETAPPETPPPDDTPSPE